VYTADAAGNLSTASSGYYVLDSTAPTTTMAAGTGPTSVLVPVQSSETGTAYLVKTGGTNAVTVTDLASITSAADARWNSKAITVANFDFNVSLSGLEDGTYTLYAVDGAGNLSAASSNNFVVDSAASPAGQSVINLAKAWRSVLHQQAPVLQRFGHMRHLHGGAVGQVCDGACHAQCAVGAAAGPAQPGGCVLQKRGRSCIKVHVRLQCLALQALVGRALPRQCFAMRAQATCTHRGGGFSRRWCAPCVWWILRVGPPSPSLLSLIHI
jgi:hypothetical protein